MRRSSGSRLVLRGTSNSVGTSRQRIKRSGNGGTLASGTNRRKEGRRKLFAHSGNAKHLEVKWHSSGSSAAWIASKVACPNGISRAHIFHVGFARTLSLFESETPCVGSGTRWNECVVQFAYQRCVLAFCSERCRSPYLPIPIVVARFLLGNRIPSVFVGWSTHTARSVKKIA